jgi:hypothetical protein
LVSVRAFTGNSKGEINCHLAVVDLPRDATPLASNADAVRAFLREADAVNDQGGGAALHRRRSLLTELSLDLLGLPGTLANEPF